MTRVIISIWTLLLWTAIVRAEAPDAAPIPTVPASAKEVVAPGQTFSFVGDSITHMGNYHQLLQLLIATRLPGSDIWTVNSGVAGEKSGHGPKRLDWDIFNGPVKPDVVFIHFGMNDVAPVGLRKLTTQPTAEQRSKPSGLYTKNMHELIRLIKARGAEVVVLSPTPYDDASTTPPEPGAAPMAASELARFAAIAQKIAAEENVPFVDLHTTLQKINEAGQAKDPKFTLIRDRVHPSAAGHEVMMHLIGRALGLPDQIYDVAIDRATQKVVAASGAEVEAIAPSADGGVSFSLVEHALPFPTPVLKREERSVDLDRAWNRQRLSVVNLEGGSFNLTIDGVNVGTFSGAELATGIDLGANPKTPQFQEAARFGELVLDRKTKLERLVRAMTLAERERWRDVPVDVAIATIDAKIAEKKARDAYRGWATWVPTNARLAFPKRTEILTELDEIRQRLKAVPAKQVRRYVITPALTSP